MKFELLEPYIPMFMSGLVVTCQVTAAALALALVLGFLIAVLKVLPCRPLRAVLNFYTSIFRGVPLIVLLFLGVLLRRRSSRAFKNFPDVLPPVPLRWGLNGSATVSETVRGVSRALTGGPVRCRSGHRASLCSHDAQDHRSAGDALDCPCSGQRK